MNFRFQREALETTDMMESKEEKYLLAGRDLTALEGIYDGETISN